MNGQRLRPRGAAAALTAIVLLAAVGCAASTPPFTNAYPEPEDSGERAGAGYMLHRTWVQLTGGNEAGKAPYSTKLDLAELSKHKFAAAWLGHASVLLRAGDKWILLDPMLTDTASPVSIAGPKRLLPPALALDALPHIDFVLISHDHFDHLDKPTVAHLAKQAGVPPVYMAGKGLGSWFADNVSVAAQEMGWWDSKVFGDLRITFTPAQHSSSRRIGGKNSTLWGGWVVELAGQRFYFAGDTAYSKQMFSDIKARVGSIDLAAIPIGAYEPRHFMRFEHVNPEEAVQAHLDLGAKESFGMHWGTFQLGDETAADVLRDLDAAKRKLKVDTFKTLPIGGVVDVPRSASQ